MRRWLAAVALALLPACDQTTLLLDLQLGSGLPQPGALRVSLYRDGIVHRSTVPTGGRNLPGTLLVENLPSGPALRVLVDGLDGAGTLLEQAAQVVDVGAARENHLTLTLGAPLPDADGDGVPDDIDDCPARPDADQKCGAAPGDLSTARDLGARDAAVPADLANRRDGAAPACPADAILCDDFETGDASKWNQPLPAMNHTLGVTIDGVRPHGGNFSLHARAQKSDLSGSWFLTLDENLATLSPPFALRVFMQSSDVLDSFTLGVALYSGNQTLSVGGDTQWVMDEDFTNNSIDHPTTTDVPLGQWVCVEVVHDGTQIHFYTDGVERTSFAPSITSPYDSMSLGLVRWPANHDAELFFDDFVLAKSRVFCP